MSGKLLGCMRTSIICRIVCGILRNLFFQQAFEFFKMPVLAGFDVDTHNNDCHNRAD